MENNSVGNPMGHREHRKLTFKKIRYNSFGSVKQIPKKTVIAYLNPNPLEMVYLMERIQDME